MQSGCLQEQLRLEKLLEEEKLLTFKPQINPYPDVQPRLSLRNPDAYLQQVRSKEAARMALQLEMRRQREVTCRVWNLACMCADVAGIKLFTAWKREGSIAWFAAADQTCGHRWLSSNAAVCVVEVRLTTSEKLRWTKLDRLSTCSTVTADPQQLCSNVSKVLAAFAAIALPAARPSSPYLCSFSPGHTAQAQL